MGLIRCCTASRVFCTQCHPHQCRWSMAFKPVGHCNERLRNPLGWWVASAVYAGLTPSPWRRRTSDTHRQINLAHLLGTRKLLAQRSIVVGADGDRVGILCIGNESRGLEPEPRFKEKAEVTMMGRPDPAKQLRRPSSQERGVRNARRTQGRSVVQTSVPRPPRWTQ